MNVQKGDLLVDFERRNFPSEYLEYYQLKRNNLFATVQNLPDIWQCSVGIDRIWLRDIDNLKRPSAATDILPLLLYLNAHAKLRIAIELGFSTAIPEANSILRDAIESVAHAHTMKREPRFQKTWLSKHDSEACRKAFEKAFVEKKQDGVFKNLPELHSFFRELCEQGSHTTIASVCQRIKTEESASDLTANYLYLSADKESIERALFTMVVIGSLMERRLHEDFRSRLHLDTQLGDMRNNLLRRIEAVRKRIISDQKLQP